MSERSEMTIRILTGEAMWPDRIEHHWPGAQFVARAQFDANHSTRPDAFAILDTHAIWGILVQVPFAARTGMTVTATTDRGDAREIWFDPAELLAGDPEGVVAAARYWELPWRYVNALKDAVAAGGIEIPDEEPRDDANIDSGVSE